MTWRRMAVKPQSIAGCAAERILCACWRALAMGSGSEGSYANKPVRGTHIDEHYTAQKQKARPEKDGLLIITGRLPSLPHTRACSTIGAEGLNFRVRDGNGWDPFAKVTQNLPVLALRRNQTHSEL